MKIISNFIDYYDHCAYTFGVDDNLIFNRKTIEKNVRKDLLKRDDAEFLRHFYTREEKDLVNLCILGFCNKYYPLFIVSKYNIDNGFSSGFLKSISSPNIAEFCEKNISVWSSKNVENYFNNAISTLKNTNLFEKYNVPYFLATKSTIYLNPQLKGALNFNEILNPQQAFQEIEMFLPQLNKIIDSKDLNDVEKIEQYGFDKKTSFRNIK